MPEWVEKLALQFPIVALIGVAVWLALRYADNRQDAFLQRERELIKEFEQTTKSPAEAFQQAEAALAAHWQEALAREKAAYDARVKALNAEVRRLRRQLRRPGGSGDTA